ncbi:hypothetical protein [Rhizobium sullae]|uniref:hypothetical protein n=1 Tax=Rhizobium sullae TaxID=50338 RepID=UPI0018E20099|nr:hypothetical protein [Rhizobium sullae]
MARSQPLDMAPHPQRTAFNFTISSRGARPGNSPKACPVNVYDTKRKGFFLSIEGRFEQNAAKNGFKCGPLGKFVPQRSREISTMSSDRKTNILPDSARTAVQLEGLSMTHDAVLELNSVACRYGATQVLDEINPSIARCEFTALLGSSGCGTTTLVRVLAGFITPPPALSPSLVLC